MSSKPTSNTLLTCPLLNSGLEEDIVGQKILPFLERESILAVVAVTPILEQFQVGKYYCIEHGSKMEADIALEGDEEETRGGETTMIAVDRAVEENGGDEVVATVGSLAEDGDIEMGIQPSMENKHQAREGPALLVCEDCLHAQWGRHRCKKCEEFRREDDFSHCAMCNAFICRGCRDRLFWEHPYWWLRCDRCKTRTTFCKGCARLARAEGLPSCKACDRRAAYERCKEVLQEPLLCLCVVVGGVVVVAVLNFILWLPIFFFGENRAFRLCYSVFLGCLVVSLCCAYCRGLCREYVA